MTSLGQSVMASLGQNKEKKEGQELHKGAAIVSHATPRCATLS
jgi:hypothetical protein